MHLFAHSVHTNTNLWKQDINQTRTSVGPILFLRITRYRKAFISVKGVYDRFSGADLCGAPSRDVRRSHHRLTGSRRRCCVINGLARPRQFLTPPVNAELIGNLPRVRQLLLAPITISILVLAALARLRAIIPMEEVMSAEV